MALKANDVADRGGGVTLSGALEAFLDDVRARGLSPRTLDFYGWQLGKFRGWAADRGVDRLDGLTAALLRAYLVGLRGRGLRDSSVHAAARALRAWLFFCERDELVPVSPMRRVKMPKVARRILPALAGDTVRALLGACETARDRALVLFMLDTGVRAAELVALNVGDLGDDGVVFVHRGKGAKDRITHVETATRAALAEYLVDRGDLEPEAPLWVTFDVVGVHCIGGRGGRWVMDRVLTDKRLTQQGLTQVVKRLGRRAGVVVSPHAFRRTCALTMHRSGARLTEIAALLGHSDLATLQKYLDLQAQDAVTAHRAHSPVAALFAGASGM